MNAFRTFDGNGTYTESIVLSSNTSSCVIPMHLFVLSFEQFSSTNVCARCLSLDDTATNDIDGTDRSAGTTFAFAMSAVDMQAIVIVVVVMMI